jgi:hypothetical protein
VRDDLIKKEIERRKILSNLIIRALKTVTEKSVKKSQVGEIQDAIFSVSGINKNPQNQRIIDLTLKKYGVVRSVYTGKHYYKNIVVKESYGS